MRVVDVLLVVLLEVVPAKSCLIDMTECPPNLPTRKGPLDKNANCKFWRTLTSAAAVAAASCTGSVRCI